jgi:hypothetical protein
MSMITFLSLTTDFSRERPLGVGVGVGVGVGHSDEEVRLRPLRQGTNVIKLFTAIIYEL